MQRSCVGCIYACSWPGARAFFVSVCGLRVLRGPGAVAMGVSVPLAEALARVNLRMRHGQTEWELTPQLAGAD